MPRKAEPMPEGEGLIIKEHKDEELTRLKPKLQRVVHMHLSGCTVRQIAHAIQFSEQYVRNLLMRPDILVYIHRIQDAEDDLIKQNIKALRMKAIAKMNRLMDSKQDAVALQAAKDVLDRTGYKGVEKKQIEVSVTTFEQQLKALLDGADVIDISDDIADS